MAFAELGYCNPRMTVLRYQLGHYDKQTQGTQQYTTHMIVFYE